MLLQPRHILQRPLGGQIGGHIHIVGLFDFHQVGHKPCGERAVPHAQARQARQLAKGSQNAQIVIVGRPANVRSRALHLGELDIRLI